MSDDPRFGVVNHRGQVYDGQASPSSARDEHGMAIHEGLYITDGSTVPHSLAANPFFTIAALAERTAHIITAEKKYADLFPRRLMKSKCKNGHQN